MSDRFNQIYAAVMFYPTLLWNMLLGRLLHVRNWWDAVDEMVVLGAYPFDRDVEELAELGIGAVINTCAEYEGPVDEYERFGIDQLRVPTTDFTHPTLESVEHAVEFMEQQINDGKRVYVHCKAGRARSATVVACWLIKNRGMTAEEAQNRMTRTRPHVNPHIAERPVVKEFERKYGQRNPT